MRKGFWTLCDIFWTSDHSCLFLGAMVSIAKDWAINEAATLVLILQCRFGKFLFNQVPVLFILVVGKITPVKRIWKSSLCHSPVVGSDIIENYLKM